MWQRKKSGKLRLCVELKVHINDNIMDEDNPKPDMETIFHNIHWASYFGKMVFSDAYSQKLDEEAKDKSKINTSKGLFKMCLLRHGLKKTVLQSSRIATRQHSKKSEVMWFFKMICRSTNIPTSSSTRECLLSVVNYVKQTLVLMEKIPTQNQSKALVFGILNLKGGNSTRSQRYW